MKNHSVLVTGSEGLIGKELSRKLRETKINVIGYDIKNGQDVLDQNSLERIISDVDGIIHLAAVSRVVTGYKDPYAAVMTNVIGTSNILDLIRRKNPSCWMVFGSSREVYGESQTIKKRIRSSKTS